MQRTSVLNISQAICLAPPANYAVGWRMKGIIAMALAGVLLCTACHKKQPAAAVSGPPEVEVAEVSKRDVPVIREWVGSLDGLVNAQIRSEVEGYLLKQNYLDGAYVRKGDLLFQIDPRPFQAALDQAKGDLEQAKGQLAQAQGELLKARAVLDKTEQDVKMYTPLAKEGALSKRELLDATDANLAAKAQVAANLAAIEAAKGNINANEAAVQTAKLNLGFTNIISPVDGVASIANAQVGNLVGPQTGVLTTVSIVNPILVDFSPSEAEYLNTAAISGALPGKEDAALKMLQFHLMLSNGKAYPQTGRIYAVNREINAGTGTILVQCAFPNPGNVLRPGGFARIKTVVRIQKGALLVPQVAVADVQGKYLIAVVGGDDKAHIRPIEVGQKVDELWLVENGLKAGERVVAEGIQKVKEGMPVKPKPYSSSGFAARSM
jgi:membrane fusion protein, multidrug efflux system